MGVAELVVQAAWGHRLSGNLSWVAMEEGILPMGFADVDNRVVLMVTVVWD